MADPFTALLDRIPSDASETSLQLMLSILQEHRMAKEAEKAAKEEERKAKELELEIVREKRALASDASGLGNVTTSGHSTGDTHCIATSGHSTGGTHCIVQPLHLLPMTPPETSAPLPNVESWGTSGHLPIDVGQYSHNPTSYAPDVPLNPIPVTNAPELSQINFLDGWVGQMSFTRDLFTPMLEDDPNIQDVEGSLVEENWADYALENTSSSSSPYASSIPANIGQPSPSLPSSKSDTTQTAQTNSSRRRRKREMKETDATCRDCSTAVAHLYLHGTEEQLAEPYVVNIRCTSCAAKGNGGASKQSTSSGPPYKKRKESMLGPSDKSLCCDVCKRKAGVGGVHSLLMSAGSTGELGFAVEVVCIACHNKYALCSDCGGGGKYRTGKWRPTQLFAANRLTCSLSHERFGVHSEVHSDIRLISLPEHTPDSRALSKAPSQDLISAILASVDDIMLHAHAQPKIMEHIPNCKTWEELNGNIEHVRHEMREMVYGEDKEMRPTCRRYLVVKWLRPKRSTSAHTPGGSSWEENSGKRTIYSVMLADWNMETGDLDNVLAIGHQTRKRGFAWKIVLDQVHRDYTNLVLAPKGVPLRPSPLRWIWANVRKVGRNSSVAPVTAAGLREWGMRPLSEVPAAKEDFDHAQIQETVVGKYSDPKIYEVWVGGFEEVRTSSAAMTNGDESD
ncbi:hypothetical protein SpCBS45565_g04843 [Spizellomyces sp. 'palustris']|nr:hypothetical protein SpCBS45565_g04843 [Spizellomyces sp. 'palustris']